MILRDCGLIRGLSYLPSFLTPQEKQRVLEVVHSQSWCHRLQRKQQYYGVKYFQTTLEDPVLQPSTSTDHHPLDLLQLLIAKTVQDHRIFSPKDPPNQILVNHYRKQHRLGMHVEDTEAFGEVIVGVSLGSTEYLRLNELAPGGRQYLLELDDRSCYVLSGEARFQWRHGIGRTIDSQKYKTPDFERISLTVRHVIDSRRKVGEDKSSRKGS